MQHKTLTARDSSRRAFFRKGCFVMLAVVLSVIVLLSWFLWSIGNSVRTDIEQTRSAMQKVHFHCAATAVVRVERAGEMGLSRYCERDRVKHGPWEFWEKQRKAAEGLYVNGQKHGTWTWFLEDGSVYRVTIYEHDEVVSDQVIDS